RAAVRQGFCEGLVVVAHDFEIDDEAWLGVEALAASVAQEFLDSFGHSTLPKRSQRRDPLQVVLGHECFGVVARWRRDEASNSRSELCCRGLVGKFSHPLTWQ